MTVMQVLVELAQERNEDIPALVYEARSSRRPHADTNQAHPPRQQLQPDTEAPTETPPSSAVSEHSAEGSLNAAGQGEQDVFYKSSFLLFELVTNVVIGHCISRVHSFLSNLGTLVFMLVDSQNDSLLLDKGLVYCC